MRTSLAAPTVSSRDELRVLTRLATPIVLANLALTFTTLLTTAAVGRVSVPELAATSLGSTIAYCCLTLPVGISQALEPLAAQALGAGESRRAWSALVAVVRLSLVAVAPALAFTFVIAALLEPIGVPAAIVSRVRLHLLGRIPGEPAYLLFFATRSFLQAHGDTRPALRATVASLIVCAVSCGLFVMGDDALAWMHLPRIGLPRLGALGAGLAASAGQITLALGVVRAARRHRPVPHATDAPLRLPARTVLQLGVPMGAQMLAEVAVFGLAGVLAGRLGTRAVSAHQVALSLASFSFMGALGVGGATSVRVGHAIGAGVSSRRVGLLGIALGVGVMTVGAVAFALVPQTLMRCFTSDASVITTGASLLRIAALFALFDGTQAVAAGALRGAGDVRVPFFANVLAHWLIGLPLALWLCFGLGYGARGLWWGLTAGLVAIATVLLARFVWITRGALRRL